MMFAPLLHMLACASHAGLPAQVNWYPCTVHDQEYVGWKLQSHDSGDEMYLYFVPDLESNKRAVWMHYGPHGDPTNDQSIGYLEVPE